MFIDMTPQQAAKRLKMPGVVLIDVRSPEEYRRGHIAGSINITISEFYLTGSGNRLPPQNTEILLCCQSGSRSARAKDVLMQMGYTRVFNIGGVRGWPLKT